jgi:hypothetical protein
MTGAGSAIVGRLIEILLNYLQELSAFLKIIFSQHRMGTTANTIRSASTVVGEQHPPCVPAYLLASARQTHAAH